MTIQFSAAKNYKHTQLGSTRFMYIFESKLIVIKRETGALNNADADIQF